MATILIVDESVDTRLALNTILSDDGHDVIESEVGPSTLEIARERQPDVILLDLTIAGMEGFDILRALKSEPATADIPVIMMAARRFPEDIARCVELGAAGSLSKPWADGCPERRVRTVLAARG